MTPRTLDALRSAVAHVLTARGEAPDALRVTHIRIGNHSTVRVVVVVLGAEVEWICFRCAAQLDAIMDAWSEVVDALHREHRAATRSGAGIRRPERRAAAYRRIECAAAALTAARAVEAGE